MEFVIPAKAGIQLLQDVLDPGACPGPDPGFAGVTLRETFYEIINHNLRNSSSLPHRDKGAEEPSVGPCGQKAMFILE